MHCTRCQTGLLVPDAEEWRCMQCGHRPVPVVPVETWTPESLQCAACSHDRLRGSEYCKRCNNGQTHRQGKRIASPNAERKESCKHGHPYTPANTYTDPLGYKICRQCRREQERLRRLTKKEALS